MTSKKIKHILIPAYDFKPALGGVAHYTHELASHWQAQGYKVTVIARKQNQSSNFDDKISYNIQRISTPATAFLTIPYFSTAIRNIINTQKVDLIYCPLWFPDGISTLKTLSLFSQKIPYYIAVHASEIFLPKHTIKHRLRSILLRKWRGNVFNQAKKIFPVSEFTQSLIQQEMPQISNTNIKTVLNGVSHHQNKKTLQEMIKTQKDQKNLLTVARLVSYKGIDTVLYSLPKILATYPNTHYFVIGEGPDKSRLLKLSEELGIHSNVHFLGRMPQEHITSAYAQSDLFIMMSRVEPPDVEGFGLVFLEAACEGTPSIGGRSGGIGNAIIDNSTGWLLDPKDAISLSKKVIYLLSHPEEIKQAGTMAQEFSHQLTWAKTAEQIARYF